MRKFLYIIFAGAAIMTIANQSIMNTYSPWMYKKLKIRNIIILDQFQLAC